MIFKLAAYGTGNLTPCVHKVCTKCGNKYTSCCCSDYEHDLKSRDYRPVRLVKEGKCPRCTDKKKDKVKIEKDSPVECEGKSCS